MLGGMQGNQVTILQGTMLPHSILRPDKEGARAHLGAKVGQALGGEELVQLPVPEVLVGAVEAGAIAAHAGCPHSIKVLRCCARPLQVTQSVLGTAYIACMPH